MQVGCMTTLIQVSLSESSHFHIYTYTIQKNFGKCHMTKPEIGVQFQF